MLRSPSPLGAASRCSVDGGWDRLQDGKGLIPASPVRMFLQMYCASNQNILLNPAVFNDPPEEVGSGLS